MSIKRPVRVIAASGHIDDAKGRQLLSTSRDDDSCEEIAACINLAPKLAEALRLAVGIVSDEKPKLDMSGYRDLLAQWDAATGEKQG